MNVEWDEQKELSNTRKHGFSFTDAWQVFEAPMLIDLDDRFDYGEERWIGIGRLNLASSSFCSRNQTWIRFGLFRCERHSTMSENPMNKHSGTDWARIDAMTDDDIDTSDIPPLTATFFKRAQVRMPKRVVTMTVQVDADVLEWFKAQGDDYERRVKAALRIYAEAHKEAA